MGDMTDNDLPKAIGEGTFHIFGVDVQCYTLDDGRAIIEQESMFRLLQAMGNPDIEIDQNELERFAKWIK